MNDHELAVLQIAIWLAIAYPTLLLAITAWRRFLRDGDVVAAANEILADHESIDSFLQDWMPLSQKLAIAESRVVDQERSR